MSDLNNLSENNDAPYMASTAESPPILVELLPIDELSPDKSQPRKFQDGEDALTSLKQNIEISQIVYTPIQYRIGKDCMKYIIMGERRWKAAKAAGLTHIPAMEYSGAVDYRIAAYMDNQDRKKLLPMEEALYLQSLLGELNIAAQELAKKVNLSKSRMSEMLKIAALDKDIQQEALSSPIWTAQKLLQLANCSGDERNSCLPA